MRGEELRAPRLLLLPRPKPPGTVSPGGLESSLLAEGCWSSGWPSPAPACNARSEARPCALRLVLLLGCRPNATGAPLPFVPACEPEREPLAPEAAGGGNPASHSLPSSR